MMDFMISLLESVCVGQFAKKNRSNRLFVHSVASPVAVNHGSQLSRSDSAPPSFSLKRITNAQFRLRLSLSPRVNHSQ